MGTRVESTLPGGALTNFSIGVRALARGTVIAGPYLSVDNNVDAGVLLSRAAASVVKELRESGNGGFGIHVELSKGAALRDNIVNGSQVYGIWDQESAGTQIIGNTVELSRTAGIYLGCSSSADLQDVGCAVPSDSSKIEHNSLLDNGDYGIAISEDSLDNYVYSNNVAGDTSYDLEDENSGCASGATVPPNSWLKNTGAPNQATSPNCIG